MSVEIIPNGPHEGDDKLARVEVWWEEGGRVSAREPDIWAWYYRTPHGGAGGGFPTHTHTKEQAAEAVCEKLRAAGWHPYVVLGAKVARFIPDGEDLEAEAAAMYEARPHPEGDNVAWEALSEWARWSWRADAVDKHINYPPSKTREELAVEREHDIAEVAARLREVFFAQPTGEINWVAMADQAIDVWEGGDDAAPSEPTR